MLALDPAQYPRGGTNWILAALVLLLMHGSCKCFGTAYGGSGNDKSCSVGLILPLRVLVKTSHIMGST